MFEVMEEKQESLSPLQCQLNTIIYGSDTPAGKLFDVCLIIAILLSVLVVMLESVEEIDAWIGVYLKWAEWVLTVLFTIEYGLRLYCVRHAWRYMTSFYGLVDLCSILPAYISLGVPGANTLIVIRILRILRVFRVLKLIGYLGEAESLLQAMKKSRRKILVFLYTIVTVVVIFGALMYLVEGPAFGFTSIPKSVYWAIVTMTTVGYGDLYPQTDWGQAIASLVMVSGYAVIAVPTGIYAAELNQVLYDRRRIGYACPGCGQGGHDIEAQFCKFCGTALGVTNSKSV